MYKIPFYCRKICHIHIVDLLNTIYFKKLTAEKSQVSSQISSQCSMTGVTKAVLCYPVCGMVHIKKTLLLTETVAHVAAAGFLSLYVVPYNHIKMCCVPC